MVYFLLGFLLSIFHAFPVYGDAPKYKISACALLPKDTGQLDKWLSYHKTLGIDHFFLYYSKKSSVPYELLKKHLDSKEVDLIFWPQIDVSLGSFSVTKLSAYENACKYAAKDLTEWLIFLELDEYLVPSEDHLYDILERYQEHAAITLTSSYFIREHSYTKNITKSKRLFSPRKSLKSPVLKTIFKPACATTTTLSPYRNHFQNNEKPVSVSQESIRIHAYKKRANVHPQRKSVFCDPGMVSLEDIKHAENMGYSCVDSTGIIDLYMEQALENENK
ncbi:MAG: glycosyltransferase family 92 protein [Chlamydiota bacterium]